MFTYLTQSKNIKSQFNVMSVLRFQQFLYISFAKEVINMLAKFLINMSNEP